MSFYNKIPVKNIIKSLDLASGSSDERKITEIINSINKKTVIYDHEVEKIERIFFIWIGTIKSNSLEYIETWIDSFQNRYDINLYIDSHFLLFNHFKRIFNIYYLLQHRF
ncbi:TcdA/TcdB catalytic glycosyltransferase domain-containing protein [Vibrio mediterranei]